jgi:hypothetical protein
MRHLMKSQPVIQNKAWFARARASQKFEFFFDAKDTSSSGGSSQSTTSTNATHHTTRNKKLLGGASMIASTIHTVCLVCRLKIIFLSNDPHTIL